MTVNFKEEIRKDSELMLDKHNVRDEFKGMTVEKRKEYCDNEVRNFDVMLLNVTGDLNTSTIIRTCHALGVRKVIIAGKNRFDNRGLVGVENYTNIERHPCLSDDLIIDETVVMEIFKSDNYFPIFVETGGEILNHFRWEDRIPNIHEGKIPLLIFGNEGRGIGDNILALRDKIDSLTVGIPMKGIVRSFNVSNAASIVIYDMVSKLGWI